MKLYKGAFTQEVKTDIVFYLLLYSKEVVDVSEWDV